MKEICKITNIECSECQPVCDSKEVKIDERKIYRQALEKYGAESQMFMMFEEMAELQKEICKYKRGKINFHRIAEEIADVEIMIEQMKLLFGIKEVVERHKQLKLERLEERLRG